MRFNKTMSNDEDYDYRDAEKKNNNTTNTSLYRSSDPDTNLIVVDTIKVDPHSRLTFSKRIKTVFPIFPGDTVVVYQEVSKDELIFKIQRLNEISDIWIVKRKKKIPQILSANPEQKKTPNKKTLQEYKGELNQQKSEIKIMIIDDDPDILRTYKIVLEGLNQVDDPKPFVINTFNSSIDAATHFLEIYKDHKLSTTYYDLIIIDLKIPAINGIQLYQIMKIIDLNIKVLFISALDAARELDGILPGIRTDDILKKPFDVDDFYSRVKNKVNQHK